MERVHFLLLLIVCSCHLRSNAIMVHGLKLQSSMAFGAEYFGKLPQRNACDGFCVEAVGMCATQTVYLIDVTLSSECEYHQSIATIIRLNKWHRWKCHREWQSMLFWNTSIYFDFILVPTFFSFDVNFHFHFCPSVSHRSTSFESITWSIY